MVNVQKQSLTYSIWNRFDPRPRGIYCLESRISYRVSHFLFSYSVLLLRGGAEPDLEPSSYAPGTEIVLTLEAPADGYVAIFHGCEETGEVKPVFPLYATDNPRVLAGQEIPPIAGTVEGPQGMHWFKVFWTKDMFLPSQEFSLENDKGLENAARRFVDALENIPRRLSDLSFRAQIL